MKILKYVFFVTVLALVYIHMQVKIIDLAYHGKAREQKIRNLIEENGNETYTILTLKSANHLGQKILDKDSDLKFIDRDHVLEFSLSEAEESPHADGGKVSEAGQNASFLSFLSVGD